MKKHTLKVSPNFQSIYPKTTRPKKVPNTLSNFEERQAKAIKEERFKKSEAREYIKSNFAVPMPLAYIDLLMAQFLLHKKKKLKEGEIR
jgi:hypothetical protein